LALGYEKIPATTTNCAMIRCWRGKLAARGLCVAGKSTLNRLELSPTGADRAITRSVTIRRPSRGCWSTCSWSRTSAHRRDHRSRFDRRFGAQRSGGRFFHGYYDCYCYLPLYLFCGRHLLASKLRRANINAAAGSVEWLLKIRNPNISRENSLSLTMVSTNPPVTPEAASTLSKIRVNVGLPPCFMR
jgi:hypothetical protein